MASVDEELSVPGGPASVDELNRLISNAAELRHGLDARKRCWFDSLPTLLQNTLYHPEYLPDIKGGRETSLDSRLIQVETLKGEGNILHQEGKYDEAIDKYSIAAGLLRYVWCIESDWREKGKIEDEILRLEEGPTEGPAVALLLACYLNAAACHLKSTMSLREAVMTCDEALKLDPSNVKARYRRAQARLQDPSCSRELQAVAIADLRAAAKTEPGNVAVRKLLAEQLEIQKKQKAADEQMHGLFGRGELYRGDHHKDHPKARDPSSIPDWQLLGNMPPTAMNGLKESKLAETEEDEEFLKKLALNLTQEDA